MVNVKNITSKLTKNADKIGMLAGVLPDFGITSIIRDLKTILEGQGHIPNIQATIDGFFNHPHFNSIAMLWLGGWVAKEFGYGKYGTPIRKFSEGYGKALFAKIVLWQSTHADEGSARHLQGMFNRVVGQPNQGSQIVQYGY